MNMSKKKAVLLSFVGATVLSLGLQSQQIFASTYASKNYNNYAYRTSQARVIRYFNNNNCNWYEDVITKPEAKPETKPEVKPTPVPEVKPEVKPEPKPEINNSISSFEIKVVELTNAERAKQGLPALKIDNELSKVAKLKSQDIHDKKYFDHNSPTYGSPFDMMKNFGISYRSAGENIAKGQRTPEEVVNAWMNSEGHRKNILGSFTHIGVGYVEDGSVWTQMFIGK